MTIYKVPHKDGYAKMFAVIIPNIHRANKIAEKFNFNIGHNSPYECPLGRGIVFEINETCRQEALEIIKEI